ncbi:carbohydrate kinase family protein [Paenibacillus caui]|uniref:carbohydrate kinase family protein n=1 Tax=Paenibacillus caui TaxID=2873927 RepID=UPI001CA92354|nr:carbohydrate kinase family protein [Paenibacillus caui]
MKQQRILCFGNVVMDGMFMLSQMPGYDEKAFADTVSWSPGGPAIHFATISARLGSHASVLGWVGDDTIGLQVKQALESKGVKPVFHQILNTQTPTAIIMVDRTGEKAVVLSPPIDRSRLPEPEEVAAYDLTGTNHIHTHLFLAPYVECMLAASGEIGISRSLDIEPSSVRRWGTEKVKSLLKLTDIIFIKEPAVSMLCPEGEDLPEKLSRIADWGPSVVVCTRGRHGSTASAGGRLFFSPSIPVVTNNSLAAGDIFAGVFVYRYLEDQSIEGALQYATAAASVAVSRSGSSLHYPSVQEIKATLAQHKLIFQKNEVDA